MQELVIKKKKEEKRKWKDKESPSVCAVVSNESSLN